MNNKGTLKTAILLAYEKGYRVSDDGTLFGVRGRALSTSCSEKHQYPTFSIAGVEGVKNKYGVYGIPVHKFAAYCFYGENYFNAECVRHLDGDVENFSKDNISLGTHSENNRDKSPEVRSAVAKKARAAQGVRPKNARFSDDQVRFIRSSSRKAPDLAREFGVTKEAIYLIRNRKNYSNVI